MVSWAESCKSLSTPETLQVKNRHLKCNPFKWKHGQKPEKPGGLILTHTQQHTSPPRNHISQPRKESEAKGPGWRIWKPNCWFVLPGCQRSAASGFIDRRHSDGSARPVHGARQIPILSPQPGDRLQGAISTVD